MNVYDFDKTIYDGDSTASFIFFCIRNYPKVLLNLPVTVWAYFLYIFHIYSKTRFKENMYRFLVYIPDIDAAVERFWNNNAKKIKKWYLAQHRNDDLIISASPEFLLTPICRQLDAELIASVVDKNTGKYTGENCHGKEKVRRFYKEKGKSYIDNFYSDSLSDSPLANESIHSFLVKGNRLMPWK